MTLRTLRPSSLSTRYATRLAVALALGCTFSAPAHAFRLAHSRVVSAPDKPLQILVGIADLTPDEQRSLMARLAEPAAWERAGVTPPVPLSSMTLRLEGGGSATRRNLRISSPEAPKGPVVDLLLNLGTSEGQRQVQVSVMQTAGGFPGLTSQAQVGSRGAAGRGAGAVGVRPGDTLYGIAQSNAVADATIYQMLVALWRANPRAFIQNNMNLVKAGVTLVVPDAATVRAIDPAEARRIFIEQQEAYARYRASLAGAAARGAAAAGAPSAGGQLGDTPPGPSPEPAPQDRVRLSSGEPGKGDAEAQAQARADAQTSTARATQDAANRVDELERNVKDLNDALAATRAADQARGGSAVAQSGDGRAAAGNGQANGLALPAPAGVGGATGAAPANSGTSSSTRSQGAGQSASSGAGTAAQPGATAQPGILSQSGASGSSGAAPQAGASSRNGSQGGQAGVSGAAGTTPGVSGDASSLGGTAGAGGTPGSPSAAAGGATSQAGAASNGSGISPSGAGSSASPSGMGGSASSPTVPGSSPRAGSSAGPSAAATSEPDSVTLDKADTASKMQDTSGLPSWLSDNLLIILTAVLAVIAFVIAWLLRRAAARREEDQDDLDDELYMSEIDPGAIDRRLEGINLDLDEPPSPGERPRPGTVRT